VKIIFMEKKDAVMIFGASSLGKAALEIFESNGMVAYGFLDDTKALHGTEINNVTVLGSTDDDAYLKLIGNSCDAFIASDEPKLREGLTKMLHERRQTQTVNAIHSSASIAHSASIGHGNFINGATVIGSNAEVGSHCLIHTGAIIDFEAVVEDFVQIGAGAIINAGAKIEKGAFIGTGAVVIGGITIGKNARVGAGSVVIAPVKPGDTVFGNPAQAMKS
jgi:sugar O-acyltransferase (sialic acid O-acetyltransferase NeuD family)